MNEIARYKEEIARLQGLIQDAEREALPEVQAIIESFAIHNWDAVEDIIESNPDNLTDGESAARCYAIKKVISLAKMGST